MADVVGHITHLSDYIFHRPMKLRNQMIATNINQDLEELLPDYKFQQDNLNLHFTNRLITLSFIFRWTYR